MKVFCTKQLAQELHVTRQTIINYCVELDVPKLSQYLIGEEKRNEIIALHRRTKRGRPEGSQTHWARIAKSKITL